MLGQVGGHRRHRSLSRDRVDHRGCPRVEEAGRAEQVQGALAGSRSIEITVDQAGKPDDDAQAANRRESNSRGLPRRKGRRRPGRDVQVAAVGGGTVEGDDVSLTGKPPVDNMTVIFKLKLANGHLKGTATFDMGAQKIDFTADLTKK